MRDNLAPVSYTHLSTPIPWDKAFAVREAEWVGASPRIIALLAAKTSRSLPGSEDRLLLFDAMSGECLQTILNSSCLLYTSRCV